MRRPLPNIPHGPRRVRGRSRPDPCCWRVLGLRLIGNLRQSKPSSSRRPPGKFCIVRRASIGRKMPNCAWNRCGRLFANAFIAIFCLTFPMRGIFTWFCAFCRNRWEAWRAFAVLRPGHFPRHGSSWIDCTFTMENSSAENETWNWNLSRQRPSISPGPSEPPCAELYKARRSALLIH